MPKYKPTNTDRIIEQEQQTNTGIYVTAGDIEHSDYDTKDWKDLQKDYTHMRNGHALISTTVDVLKYPIQMSEYRLEGKNQEANDYVSWVFDNLEKGFDYLRRHKLLALDFGLSMHEVVIKRGVKYNGKLTNCPVWFNPIQNETINRFHYDEQSRFRGIEHEKRIPEKGSDYINIYNTKNKQLYGQYQWNLETFSFNEEFNDIRGRALLRPVRLFWDSEVKILQASVTGIQRGAGIPIIYTTGEPSATDQAKIAEIGRTICQLRNGYVSANKERVEIKLEEVKNQQNVMQMLEWLDGKMFFNTMSQFMISGIGSNGSRAATSEHKSSYELYASYVLQSLEDNMQQLVNRIMKESYLAKIPQDQWPEFHFNAITQADLTKVASNLKTLIDSSAITKQRKDEEMFREMFGLPTLDLSTKIVEPNKNPTSMFDKKDDEKDNKKLGKKERTISADKLEFEERVFSLASANEHYETMENKIGVLLQKKYSDLIDDITSQLKKDRFKNITIRNSFIEETIDDVMELYKQGFNRGERDIKTEIKKIGGDVDNIQLALSKKTFDETYSILAKLIKKLFMNTKTSVEIKMSKLTDQFIAKQGGVDKYLDTWKDGSKHQKNAIKSNAEAGYIDGRGKTLMDIKDNIETFMISTSLDRSLCDACAPYDGLVLTYDELKAEGLNMFQPVNPFCYGNSGGANNCRCIVLPYKYGKK